VQKIHLEKPKQMNYAQFVYIDNSWLHPWLTEILLFLLKENNSGNLSFAAPIGPAIQLSFQSKQDFPF
jgi:hypothetical protein